MDIQSSDYQLHLQQSTDSDLRLASITHWRMIQARNERRDTVAAAQARLRVFATGTIAILAAMLAAAFGVI